MSNIIKDNKKKIIIILVILEIISIFLVYKSFISKSKISNLSNKEENNVNKKRFSMYKENDNGEYEEYTESNLFPTGYIINLDRSVCIDNSGKEVEGILSRNGNNITVTSNKTVFCYLYFDKGTSISLTVSTDGVENTLPTYNHYQETLTCDNGTTSYFSTKYQRLEISQVSNANTECNLNYTSDTNTYTLLRTKVESVGTKIESTNNVGGTDISYRYTGKTPSNYVWFNNELWRIIGSIPVVSKNGTLEIFENRVKIIRNQSIGGIAYDIKSSEYTGAWGYNTLYKLLNEYYYGKKNANDTNYCYGYYTSAFQPKANCDYRVKGISSDSNDYYGRMVIEVRWNTGKNGINDTETSYINETATQDIRGRVGLMTVSDYGYAGLDYTTSLYYTAYGNYNSSNWLYAQKNEWTSIQSTSFSYYANYLYYGGAGAGMVTDGYSVRPVVYLDDNVYIISGTGTESDPYILGM